MNSAFPGFLVVDKHCFLETGLLIELPSTENLSGDLQRDIDFETLTAFTPTEVESRKGDQLAENFALSSSEAQIAPLGPSSTLDARIAKRLLRC